MNTTWPGGASSSWGMSNITLPTGSYLHSESSVCPSGLAASPQLDIVGPPNGHDVYFGQGTAGSVSSLARLNSWSGQSIPITNQMILSRGANGPCINTGEGAHKLNWLAGIGTDRAAFSYTTSSDHVGVGYTLVPLRTGAATITALSGGSASADQRFGTRLFSSVSGSSAADGTQVTFLSRILGAYPVPDVGFQLQTSVTHFALMILGTTTGSLSICIDVAYSTTSYYLVYWSGTSWVQATGTQMVGNSVCGSVPLSLATSGIGVYLGAGH
jgi:hypothetical protein